MHGEGLRQASTIALLSPYNGGNLGDSAIQEAVIANLRQLDPEVQLCGITLDPARTAALHGIPCFPLTATSTVHYEISSKPSDKREPKKKNLYDRIRGLARKVPPVVWLKTLILEVLHAIRTYRMLCRVRTLVIAGGGQLDDEWGGTWGHPYALMKCCLLARVARTKVVFLSVGVCRAKSRLTKLFLRTSLFLASYRSYRDAESRRLALMICNHADGSVAPDLAFSHPIASTARALRPKSQVLQVGISPIAWAKEGLWPTTNKAQHERYITELQFFIEELLRRKIGVKLFSSSAPDEQIIAELQRRLQSGARPEGLSAVVPLDVAQLMEVLQSVDIVVASRLHGVLLSFLCGTPAIALSYDRKVAQAMSELGQANYSLNIELFNRADLLESFSMLAAKREQIAHFIQAICGQYRTKLQEQYRMLVPLSSGSAESAPDYVPVLASDKN